VAEPGTVLTVGANGYGKRTPVEEFPTKGRGTKGVISMRIGERNAEQVGAVLVRPGDEIMLITEAGTLVRTGVDGISVLSRNTWGVKLINLGEGAALAGIERIVALNGDGDDGEDADEQIRRRLTWFVSEARNGRLRGTRVTGATPDRALARSRILTDAFKPRARPVFRRARCAVE
jgi:hypothetical protein